MNTSAALALSASVAMHVAWNLLTRAAPARQRFLWWALLGWILTVGPWSLLQLARDAAWDLRLAACIAATCVAECLYFIALGQAYRMAPVALVYPIARSSPVLIALWGSLFFAQPIPGAGWLGILVCVAGLLWLAWTGRGGDARHALPWAMLAALGTSGYSTSNKLAVPQLPSYGAQLGLVTCSLIAAWVALSLEARARSGRWTPAERPRLAALLTGGWFIGNAYGLVIFAMQTLPAAYAVAFTNAGIVIATLIAMLWLGEREHWQQRLGAVGVTCAGLGVLALA